MAVAIRYVNTASFHRLLIDKVNGQITGQINVGNIDLSLMQGRCRLLDVQVLDTNAVVVAAVRQATISIAYLPLLERQVAVTALQIDGLDLDLRFDDQDRLSLVTAFAMPDRGAGAVSPPPSGAIWQVRVDDFQLRDSHVRFNHPIRKLKGSAGPLAIQGRFDSAGPDGALAMVADMLAFSGAGIDNQMTDLRLTAAYRKTAVRPWQVSLTTPQARLSAKAGIRLDEAIPVVDAVIDAQSDLAWLQTWIQTWLPKDFGLQGKAVAAVQISGSLADPRAAVDLKVSQAGAYGVNVTDLAVDAALQERRVALNNVQGRGPWGKIGVGGTIDLQAVFPNGLLEPAAGINGMTYDLRVSGAGLKLWQAADLPLPWIGTWKGTAKLNGSGVPAMAGNQGRGSVDLSVAGIRIPPGDQPIDGTVTTQVRWNGLLLDVLQCRVGIPDQVLQAQGQIDLDRLQLDADGRLVSGQIATLGHALGIPLPQGQAEVKLTAHGALSHPEASADLLAQEVQMASYTLGRVLVSARLDADYNLDFPRLVLENKGSYLQGNGYIHFSEPAATVGLDLDFDHLQPADFSLPSVVDARFNGHLKVSGLLKDPQGHLDLKPSTVVWNAHQASVQGQAQWYQGQLKLSEIQLAMAQSSARLSGDLQFTAPETGQWRNDPLADVTLTIENVDLADIQPEFKGQATGSVSIRGPLTHPEGVFSVAARQVNLKYQNLDAVDISGRISDQVVLFDHIAIVLPENSRIEGDGQIGLDRTYRIHLAGQGIALSRIDAMQRATVLNGQVELAVDGAGSFQHPELTADIFVRQPVLGDHAFEDFHLHANLTGLRLLLDNKMNFNLFADCNVASGDFLVKADFHDTELSPFLSLAGGVGWQGHLSGNLNAAGNWYEWQQAKADVHFQDLALIYNQQAILKVDALNFTLTDGKIELPRSRLSILDSGYLNIAADGDLYGELKAQADGRIPVSALDPFIGDPDETTGTVVVYATASGPWDRLQWQTAIDLDQVGYVDPYFSQTIRNLNGRFVLTQDQMSVSGVEGMVESGRFSLEGKVQLDHMQPIDGRLVLTLKALPLQIPETLDLSLSGELALTGAPSRALLEGDLVVLEGTYYKDIRLDLWSLVSQPKRTQSIQRTLERPQWLNNIDLDVALRHRYPFLVDNNVAKLEIVPDLKMTGTLANPIINGRASVSEGEVIFRGKSFPVTRGVVDFLDPTKIDPELDILSTTTIRTWEVSLSVTGSLNELKLTLSSNPPLPENDILSLIIFGRTNSELTTGRGGGSATTQQMLAGLMATALGDEVKKTTGVDILEVDTGARTDDDSADRIQVTVGKNLTSRITVKYEVESNNGEMIQRAISEYRFTEQLLASGFQDSKGRYGGELLFRFEFQ